MGIHPSDTRDTGGGISHRKQYSPHNSSHGYPRISHGFLFSDMKKARNKTIRGSSVIIRVIDNLSVRDTTADYNDLFLTSIFFHLRPVRLFLPPTMFMPLCGVLSLWPLML